MRRLIAGTVLILTAVGVATMLVMTNHTQTTMTVMLFCVGFVGAVLALDGVD